MDTHVEHCFSSAARELLRSETSSQSVSDAMSTRSRNGWEDKRVDRGLRSSIWASLRGSAPAASSNPPDISLGEMPPPLCKGGNGFWGGLGPQQQWKIPSRITHRPAHGHEIRLSILFEELQRSGGQVAWESAAREVLRRFLRSLLRMTRGSGKKTVDRGLRSSILLVFGSPYLPCHRIPPTFRRAKCHPLFAKGGMGFGRPGAAAATFPPSARSKGLLRVKTAQQVRELPSLHPQSHPEPRSIAER